MKMRLPGCGCSQQSEIGPESVNRLAPACNFDHGTSSSESGDIRHGKIVTTAGEALNRSPAVVNPPVPPTLEQMLRSFLDGQRQRQRQPPQQRPTRRDWTDVVCFSCGKSGHTVTCCPNLNEAFPFRQPGWRTEKTPGGFVMIPPGGTTDRRRAENDG